MSEKVVIWGTAHRMREPGKCSTDGRLKEAVYSRDVCNSLQQIMESYGVRSFVDMMETDLPRTMQTPSVKLECNRELALRVNEVNSICDRYGKDNCLYVSIHVNASNSDGQWHNANGWQVCVSPLASERSHLLAESLGLAAESNNLKVRKQSPDRLYWEQSLYVLNRTHCPAVLTENLFMDNEKDVDFLLSDEGRHVIERLHVEGILRYLNKIEMK